MAEFNKAAYDHFRAMIENRYREDMAGLNRLAGKLGYTPGVPEVPATPSKPDAQPVFSDLAKVYSASTAAAAKAAEKNELKAKAKAAAQSAATNGKAWPTFPPDSYDSRRCAPRQKMADAVHKVATSLVRFHAAQVLSALGLAASAPNMSAANKFCRDMVRSGHLKGLGRAGYFVYFSLA